MQAGQVDEEEQKRILEAKAKQKEWSDKSYAKNREKAIERSRNARLKKQLGREL